MIPKFPKFKNLELSDQVEIEKITAQYPPFSDFDFENMWSWDINQSIKISMLNGNLVMIAKDIYTNDVVCSYLGNKNLVDTLYNLFDFVDSTGTSKPRISLVPEASLKGIDFSKYFIEIDLNTCDYVYDLKLLSGYAGNRYMQKRGRRNNFIRNYPDARIENLDLSHPKVKEQILNLNNSWVQNKNNADDTTLDKELVAIERFLEADFDDVHCIGVYHDELIGYAVFSTHGPDYLINHFIKADISYKGVYEYLIQECAAHFVALNYKLLNYMEDMGIPGLRRAKMTYRPLTFLRKYFVKRL